MHKPMSPGRSDLRSAGRLKTIVVCAVTLSGALAVSAWLPVGKILGRDGPSRAIGKSRPHGSVAGASANGPAGQAKEAAPRACLRVLNNEPTPELAVRAGFESLSGAQDFLSRNRTAITAVASELRAPFERRFRQLADCVAPDPAVKPVLSFVVEWRLVAAPPSLVGDGFKLLSVKGLSPDDPALKRCFARSFAQPIAARSDSASMRGFLYDRVFPIPTTYRM
jgi:hypothetical protein